jgi:hypothetical protein
MINLATLTSEKLKNVIAPIFHFTISQSDVLSEKYASHLSRIAEVGAAEELVKQEINIYSETKKQLLQKYIDANDIERIRINQDIEYVDSNVRHFNIVNRAIQCLPASQESTDKFIEHEEARNSHQQSISTHWLDKFNELSRARNEEWRSELLSRALATEASRPGTVSPRALWLIGTLEEPLFIAFATILDLCSYIDGKYMIPNPSTIFVQKPIPDCEIGDKTIGNLVYLLSDIGILSQSSTLNLPQENIFSVMYGSEHYHLECLSNALVVGGVIPTLLGLSVASFYPRKFNPLGEEIFKTWIDSLDKSQFHVVKLPMEITAHEPILTEQ